MRFDEVRIGDFFAYVFPDSCIRIFQKKSASTAHCFRGTDNDHIELRYINRTPEIRKFSRSNRVFLVD